MHQRQIIIAGALFSLAIDHRYFREGWAFGAIGVELYQVCFEGRERFPPISDAGLPECQHLKSVFLAENPGDGEVGDVVVERCGRLMLQTSLRVLLFANALRNRIAHQAERVRIAEEFEFSCERSLHSRPDRGVVPMRVWKTGSKSADVGIIKS